MRSIMSKNGLESTIAALRSRCAMPANGQSCEIADRSKCWMMHDHGATSPISSHEIISLTALIAYVAHMTGQSEFRIERNLADYFCVPSMKCLPADQYDLAVQFLADQVPARAVNA